MPGAVWASSLGLLLSPPHCVGLQQPLGLGRLLLFLSSTSGATLLTTAGGCGPGAAPPAAGGLSLPGAEDRPGQEESWLRGPRYSPPPGSCQAFLPWRGEWALLRLWLQAQLCGGAEPHPPACLPVAQAPRTSVPRGALGRVWPGLS